MKAASAVSLPLAFLSACGAEPLPADLAAGSEPAPAVPPSPYSDDGPYLFKDATGESGLGVFQQVNGSAEKPFLVETVGGGCALFDHDQDGDLDAYLTNGGRLGQPLESNPSDALFQNDGRGHFTDVSQAARIDERRWTNGVRACDLDADGWVDLYLTNYGPNTLYMADGRGGYEDRGAKSGLDDASWSTGAAFLDFDRDGDLDLHVANYVVFDEAKMLAEGPLIAYQGAQVMKGPRGLPGAPDHFYVNEGQGRFREASAELGMSDELFGFQDCAFDFDLDGWLDLFVANDSVANNLWHNLAGKRFEDVALRQGVAFSLSGQPQAGMGVALGDYNGDQRIDLYVTNFMDDYSTLYRGEEGGFFLDVTHPMALAAPSLDKLSWGTGFEDFDCDGDLELYVVSGHVYPQVDRFHLGSGYRQPAQLFDLDGKRYREPPGRGGLAMALPLAARGTATGDVDGDGDVDLLIECIDGPPRLLRNETRCGNAIVIEVVGAGQNREAVGARVVVMAGGKPQLRLVGVGTGFLSSSSPALVFGLGALTEAESIEVTWPLGRVDRLQTIPAGMRVRIVEGEGDVGADFRVTRL